MKPAYTLYISDTVDGISTCWHMRAHTQTMLTCMQIPSPKLETTIQALPPHLLKLALNSLSNVEGQN